MPPKIFITDEAKDAINREDISVFVYNHNPKDTTIIGKVVSIKKYRNSLELTLKIFGKELENEN